MNLMHLSDLHYCPEHLDEVDRVCNEAARIAIERRCDAAVLSGDIFDHRLDLHTPAVGRALALVHRLADWMPVLILQGTYSHDARGSLDVFKTIGGRYPVHVADRICQVALYHDVVKDGPVWVSSDDWRFNELPRRLELLASCLPPVNKAALEATADGSRAQAAGDAVFDLMRGWSVINAHAAAAGIPTIVVSHGTVNGSTTEQGCPMHGNDHEFTTGALFASGADAILLGHIHQHQEWHSEDGRQVIAYPGSPGRLHFGELTPKGFLIWDINPGRPTTTEFVELPAKRLVQLEFDGPPDLDKVAAVLEDCQGAHVRVRWTVDEDQRDQVRRDELERLLAGASAVKLEGRIRPTQRQRAAGISHANTLGEKLFSWCEATENEAGELMPRLQLLQTAAPDLLGDGTTLVDLIRSEITPQEIGA